MEKVKTKDTEPTQPHTQPTLTFESTHTAEELARRKLMAQDSIHTIKEDDFNKEEDETLHEESRELRKSPESPGRRVP